MKEFHLVLRADHGAVGKEKLADVFNGVCGFRAVACGQRLRQRRRYLLVDEQLEGDGLDVHAVFDVGLRELVRFTFHLLQECHDRRRQRGGDVLSGKDGGGR